MTSDPGSDDRYVVRDTIEVTVTFSAAVTVTGTPRLTLNVGSPLWILIGRATRNADYKRRPEATKLVFGYTVAAGDNDTDGVSIVANALSLNGATISDTHGVVAQLVHNALPAQSGHLVDTTAPTVLDIFVDGAKLAIGYSETLDESSEPAANRFRVSVDGATRTVSDVAVTGKAVELTLSPAVHPGEAVQVRYTAPSTDPVRDLAGLAGGGFGYSDHEVTNLTRPTVSIAAADADIYEGTDADFILTRSGPTDSSLTAEVLIVDGGDVTDSETGRRTVDVEFRAGHSTASLAVATLDDRDYEAHARVSATVTPSSGYTVSSSAGSATVTVSDNDVPATDIVLAAPATIQEEAGMLTVRMRATTVRDEVPHGAVSVRLTSADGTAVSGENGDFTAVDVAVRLAIDDFARVAVDGEERHVYVATAERQIVIHDDSVSEPEETLTLRLRRSSGLPSRVTLPERPISVSIIDDEAPDRPINVTVSPGNTELTASWSPATGATGYRVQWKSGATETFGTAPADNRQLVVSGGDTTVAVIRNLMNGTAYTVRVIAFKPVRDGPPSEEATATPQTPPSRVTGVMASGRDGALAVSWSAPMRATGYKVQWKSGAAETFERAVADGREAVVSGNSSTRHTIADLRHCTPYTVRVIATNRGVDGPASAEVEGTPTFEPERARLGTVLVSNTGQSVDDAISVHIVASGSYTQEFTTGPGTGGFLLESVGIHIRSVVPPDTEPQFAHIHEVHRGGGLGARLYRLAPPNRLACNRVNLLKAPAYAPLEPDHRYLLAFPISPTDTIDIRVAATSSDAEDGGKASGWSIDNAVKLDSSPLPTGEALMISVNARRPTPPGAPARLVATAGDGGVTLAWTAPILDGGVPVIAYEYRYRKDSEADFPTGWNAVADSGDEGTETGNERSVTVAGLDNGALYRFELRAVNRAGRGTAREATATPTAGLCNAPDLAGRRTKWTGTLTLGAIEAGGQAVGYGFSGSAGQLSDKTFTVGANSYTVDAAYRGVAGTNANRMIFGLTSALDAADKGALRLHVCGASFDLSESTGPDGQNDYDWPFTVSTDWSTVTTRQLRLTTGGNRTASGAPALAGAPQVHGTLTASIGTVMDADGLPQALAYSWQWFRVDAETETEIGGATGATYTSIQADTDKRLKVRLRFADLLGGAEELFSAATDPVVDITAPTVVSIARQSPATSPTNANSLTWRVTFSEAVENVDAADFEAGGPTGATLAVADVPGAHAVDVTVSGATWRTSTRRSRSPSRPRRTSPIPPATRSPTPRPPAPTKPSMSSTTPRRRWSRSHGTRRRLLRRMRTGWSGG